MGDIKNQTSTSILFSAGTQKKKCRFAYGEPHLLRSFSPPTQSAVPQDNVSDDSKNPSPIVNQQTASLNNNAFKQSAIASHNVLASDNKRLISPVCSAPAPTTLAGTQKKKCRFAYGEPHLLRSFSPPTQSAVPHDNVSEHSKNPSPIVNQQTASLNNNAFKQSAIASHNVLASDNKRLISPVCSAPAPTTLAGTQKKCRFAYGEPHLLRR
jgi:hypothetical protein